ncbi:MAG TPA: transcriptional repressor [Bauldia sp.]|nr:transcriptional repressor [Bauldia sp.]
MTNASAILEHREHDHGACERQAIRHAEEISRRENLRFTSQRRQVLQALLESHVPASAYDIIDRLAEAKDGARLAPVSVYRALDFLVAHNFAHRIESKNAFVACDRGADCEPGATLFLICDNCGAAAEASSEALGALVTTETKMRAFLPRLRVLEVRGLCARCQAA